MITYRDMVATLLQELDGALQAVDPQALDALRGAILAAPHIFAAGKGRSGLQMRAFAMRLMHMGLSVYVVGDVTTPAITAGDLLVIGSGSGRTASLVQYAGRAVSLGARVALITIDPESPVARQADYIIRIPATTPKLPDSEAGQSVLPMGSLFEQALGLLLDILIVQLMAETGTDAGQMFSRHANLE